MYKLISNTFNFQEPTMRRLDQRRLVKSADTVTQDYLRSIKSEPGRTKLLTLFLGAGEYYSCNLNGDFFSEADLIKTHQTFKTHGKVYRHHENKDPKKSFGEIEFVTYNHKMHRVEGVMSLVDELCADVLEKLDSGSDIPVSMAARLIEDVCVRKGTKITTCDGRKPIEDVVAGDWVLTHTGRFRRVTNTMQRHTNEIYEVKVVGMPDKLYVTGNHPVYGFKKDDIKCPYLGTGHLCFPRKRRNERCRQCPIISPQWHPVEALKENDYIGIGSTTHVYYGWPHRLPLNDDMARLLGYYLADGCILKPRSGADDSGPHYLQGITITGDAIKDQDYFCDILDICKRLDLKHYHYFDDSRHCQTIQIHSKELAIICQMECGEYSATKRLSSNLLYATQDIQRTLLRCWLKGDGSLSESTGGYRGMSVSEQLINDFHWICMRLKMIVAMSKCKVSAGSYSSNHEFFYQLAIPKSQIDILFSTDVGSVSVSSQMFYHPDGLFTPIDSIVKTATDEVVYNISVGDDESYVANGLIVHNCVICNHRSKTFAEYCDHLKHEMCRIYDDGRKVYALNPDPTFFDISLVWKPADQTAYALKKVASADALPYRYHSAYLGETIIDPAQYLRKVAALSIEKQALVQKLADLEKQVGGIIAGKVEHGELKQLCDHGLVTDALSDDQLSILKRFPLEQILGSLTGAKVMLLPDEFARLLGCDDCRDQLSGCLPQSFRSLAGDDNFLDFDFPLDNGGLPIYKIMSELLPRRRLDDNYFQKAMTINLDRPPQTTITISGNGVGIGQSHSRGAIIIKRSAVTPQAVNLAKLYNLYKVGFCLQHPGKTSLLVSVLTNFQPGPH